MCNNAGGVVVTCDLLVQCAVQVEEGDDECDAQ